MNVPHIEEITKKEMQFKFELQTEKKKAEEKRNLELKERRNNLQLTSIAAFIFAFGIFILWISKRKVAPKTVEILGIIALLFFFEFINLLIHPYLLTLTRDTPWIMIIIMVVIASILAPAHHGLNKYLKVKLCHKKT